MSVPIKPRELSCGHIVFYNSPCPNKGYKVWCVKCDAPATVAYGSPRKDRPNAPVRQTIT